MSVKSEEYPDCENNNSDPDAHLWITNCLMSENEKDPMIKLEELHLKYLLQICVHIRTAIRGLSISIDPSRVRALPLAAGINVGGHYFR